MQTNHAAFCQALTAVLPADRIFTDELYRLTYGTDASFYRLIPEVVVKVVDESEVMGLLQLANQYQVPVTFRAAGTSLSGQAVSDSVLVVLEGNSWKQYQILQQGAEISLQPGIIGAQANQYLAPLGRKIGPDPASINTCKIGGIAANNASGMCCGTAQNSYHTLAGMRVILVDGTVLDTRDAQSRHAFSQSHTALLQGLSDLAAQVQANPDLKHKIQHKFRLKNTTGYSLNALVDYQDAFEILQHLLIGSEGTLGFIAAINYQTVPDYPHKATGLVLFSTIEDACLAVTALKPQPVDAVELIDRAGLRSVQDKPGMPAVLQSLDSEAAALLIDIRAPDAHALTEKVAQITTVLGQQQVLQVAEFTTDPKQYAQLWNIRKGLFPAVGAVRPVGTTVIIEDVAFPIEQLAQGTRDLQALFNKHAYHEAIIFGHALEGNLHFVFTQDFSTDTEVQRYAAFMQDVSELVALKYGGSLKAEHGTGRNMAPFVEMEWGKEAYAFMWQIKRLFDPKNLLNPGVILNNDANVHLKHLKPMPAADSLIDRCIECGFCEPVCPSRNLTLSPRQRIVTTREYARLQAQGASEQAAQFKAQVHYALQDTCALDGLCATRCPVNINTGELVRSLRSMEGSDQGRELANDIAAHMATTTKLARAGLQTAKLASSVLGADAVTRISQGLHHLSKGVTPIWTAYTPRKAKPAKPSTEAINGKVVYFPACVTRTMGTACNDSDSRDLMTVMNVLLAKAGFAAIIPPKVDELCCGMPFNSKGYTDAANQSVKALEAALWQASEAGKYPILCDTSPCTLRMLEQFTQPLKVYETAGFIAEYLLPHLNIQRQEASVALHITCSTRRLGLEAPLRKLAKLCAQQVIEPEEEGCCGFAGDKGFTTPELNASALQRLKQQLPETCKEGFSNSRTCEIGLSQHSGRQYRSIAYLVERCC